MTSLRLDWCDTKAAKYAVEHWHYSRRMPLFKLSKIGVWEDGGFIGAVIFGCGASPSLAAPFGLSRFEACELVRIALKHDHATPVSRIVAIALKMLHLQCPQLRLVVSFADSAQGHHGGIYQANGWLYLGQQSYHAYVVNGKTEHSKTLSLRYGYHGQCIPWLRANVDPNAERVLTPAKHKYAMPLDDELRRQLEPLRQPYPKRVHE